MNYLTKSMTVPGSLPESKLVLYLQDQSPEIFMPSRPMVVICPGGGYCWTSDREAEAIALQFLAMGYHAAVLRYSCAPATYPTALLEAADSIRYIRANAQQWHVDPGHVYLLGCSAGGHLAGHLGVAWNREVVQTGLGLKKDEDASVRPDGLILCYPVITAGEFSHQGSFQNLLGGKQELEKEVSLEHLVTDQVPPVFLWHTFTDPVVPVENSLLFAAALRKVGVSTELHLYAKGGHGLSLANKLTRSRSDDTMQPECTSWVGLVHTWIESRL